MSAYGRIDGVEDDMYSEASINVPQGPRAPSPPAIPPVQTHAEDMQMVAGTSSGSVVVSRKEAETAFSKVQDVFTRMSKEHTKIQGDLKTLVPHVGQLTHTQLAEQKALAAAKQAL